MHDNQLKSEAVYEQERMDRFLWDRGRDTGMSRRRMLQMMGGGVGATLLGGFGAVGQGLAACAAATPIVKPTPADQFRLFNTNAEMRYDSLPFVNYLVPNEKFFVRTHTCAPPAPADYHLEITGDGVEKPLSLSLEELMEFRSRSVIKFVECAGNGRSFFTTQQSQTVSGTAWLLGAIGVALWEGVQLSDVLDCSGLKENAVDVMPEGFDNDFVSGGTNFGHVRRPIPIEKALDDVLIVYKMNGQPLPIDHGAPVRMLVPGWVGIANIKWVGKITVSTATQTSPFNTTFYSTTASSNPDLPVGTPLTNQGVKAAFTFPPFNNNGATAPTPVPLTAGPQLLTGRAWSGTSKIDKVEVSFDDGATYCRALLIPPNLSQAWVRWVIFWNPAPGNYSLKARATDADGRTQPITANHHPQGYQFGAIVRVPVTVT